ncbi:hypothetical protein EZS27_010941 [termite gut metagenome]|uniref:DUF5683 domain-containing protein n=1 Tax=termite gut metagenome TaxID=433724 RepID=A0A5J4S631_9ZZZZ
MTGKGYLYQLFVIPLFFFFIQIVAEVDSVYAQNQRVSVSDSLKADSLTIVKREDFEKMDFFTFPPIPESMVKKDSAVVSMSSLPVWIPNPTKATWLALVFPGGGQIYNRKYWKLPIIYGGFVGCAYGLSWNNNMYKDYSKAYLDIMDDNPNTNSFLDMLPSNVRYEESYLKELFKKRKDMYRRYRDMTVFAFIGVYLISVIDAYVDAELSNFDISPNLSLHITPTIINDRYSLNKTIGLQCSFKF